MHTGRLLSDAMRNLIDTNYIVRFLLGPEEPGYQEAEKAILDGCETLPETIPEAIYVMEDVYHVDRRKLSDALLALLDDVGIEHEDIIRQALYLFGKEKPKLDYVDCLFLSIAERTDCNILTFDKKTAEIDTEYSY